MENEAKKEEGDKETPGQVPASPDEKNNSTPPADAGKEGEEGKENNENHQPSEADTPPTPEQIATWKKKAEDFDKSTELKRLAKLGKKGLLPAAAENQPAEEGDEPDEENPDPAPAPAQMDIQAAVRAEIARAFPAVAKEHQETYTKNLKGAYDRFLADNPWANNDEIIDSISLVFDPKGAINEEELLARMNIAAQTKYPAQWQKASEDRIAAKVLANQRNIEVGSGNGGSGGGSIPSGTNQPNEVVATDADKRVADKFFNGDIKRYLKYKNTKKDKNPTI